MQNTIVSGQSINTIENSIKNEIQECEFWGDLDLTYDELEIMKDCFRSLILKDGVTISNLCNNYPHSVTTFMVFFVRYKYDINFWRALGDEMGIEISINQHSEIGACAREMFEKYKMDISDTKDEPRQIIAPIIFEACLPPESSLNDLFYIMNYDVHKVFDPQLIIDELIEMRSYKIRKPMYRFLSRFKDDRAVDFVLEVRDAMISSEQHSTYHSRFSTNYTEWKEQEKSKAVVAKRKNQEYQTRPYLFFDNGNKGLCVLLPRTIIVTEWIEEVTWYIHGSNGFVKTVACRVIGDEGRRYTDTVTVAVSPAEKYIIRLEDTERLDKQSIGEWEINGISDKRILYFNANGRQVNPNFLLVPYGIMIFPREVQILKSNSVDISEQYYPTNLSDYRVLSITPMGSEANLAYGDSVSSHYLISRPHIEMFLDGDTLFGMDISTNVFTQIPVLHITAEEGVQTAGIEIHISGIVSPVKLNPGEDNVFELKRIARKEMDQYGTYSVRLYQTGRFLKQVEFNYVPRIKTDYTPFIGWPNTKHKGKKTYRFSVIEDWEMEFEGCIVTHDEKNYSVEVPSSVASIPVVLKSLQDSFIFKCEMNLPVRPFEAEIIDGEGNEIENVTDRVYKIGVDSLLENDKWVMFRAFGRYKNESFCMRLKTANGIEQTEWIHLTQHGAGNINLSIFNDTIRNCPLPAEIEVMCNDKDNLTSPILSISEKLVMEFPIRYQIGEKNSIIILNIADDGKDIDVVRFGFDRKDVHIPYSNSLIGKSGKVRGYIYPGMLREGIYVISGSKKQSAFEFEDETVELVHGNNVIFVNTNEKEAESVQAWLDQLIMDCLRTGSNKDLIGTKTFQALNVTHDLDDIKKAPLDDEDIEKLVALAFFAKDKIVKTKKEQIKQCMRLLSSKVLQRGNRYRIIELLVDLDVPQEVFDISLAEYSLCLFYSDSVKVRKLASRVERNSVELSMLLMMSANGSIRDCILREKYRDLIGKDAIRKLLSVPGENNLETIAKEQKGFLHEVKGNSVKINLSDEIAGNEEAIQGMIVWDRKYPMLDIKKKPEYGVYFARIKYVDQYVNWYKNTHDKNGNMNPEKRILMADAIKKYANVIEKAFVSLAKNDSQLSQVSSQYAKTLRARCKSNGASFSYSRFFYLQGLAAFLAKLPMNRADLDDMRIIGIHFMEVAFIVAPRLSLRDVLMAETYRYLKRKEEALCR